MTNNTQTLPKRHQLTPAQRSALSPKDSVWMTASAGSGKTSVLTNRVVRLLLEGVLPSRILCITYTKAAAAEMLERVRAKLAQWATAEDAWLQDELTDMLGHTPSHQQALLARRLFTSVMEAQEGLRIHTIHAFCQHILQRFPLEAGVPPHFEVLDDRKSAEMLESIKWQLFSTNHGKFFPVEKISSLREALSILVSQHHEQRFDEVLSHIIMHRAKFEEQLSRYGDDFEALERDVWQQWQCKPKQTKADLLRTILFPLMQNKRPLHMAHEILESREGANDKKFYNVLTHYLSLQNHEDILTQQAFLRVWLTKEGTARKTLYNKEAREANPALYEELQAIQTQVEGYYLQGLQVDSAELTYATLMVADAILKMYAQQKNLRAALDYDDQILHCRRLLEKSSAAQWVQFKLDGGIQHILLDEAQDTSPAQWDVLMPMIKEFFAGEGQHTAVRTLFVVGDEKQSIYSFQGARPDILQQKREDIAALAASAGKVLHFLPMNQSFRSAPQVLQAVDTVFAQAWPKAGAALSESVIQHSTARKDAKGAVVLWPPLAQKKHDAPNEKLEKQASHFFQPPTYQSQPRPTQQMAERIAGAIQHWLDKGMVLSSMKRTIQAGDILILVRNRGALVHDTIRALKQLKIPVAGADRLNILDEIAVQDMLALARFALLPSDNYTLACVLKSPLLGWTEEQLQALAYQRGETTLWQKMQEKAEFNEFIYHSVEWLKKRLASIDFVSPFHWFSMVLEHDQGWQKMQARLGSACVDGLQQLLQMAQQYAQEHVSSMLGFLEYLSKNTLEIKREMSTQSQQVRVMTVHNAKGLQAPVVILPDMMREIPNRSSNKVSMMWDEHGNLMSTTQKELRKKPRWMGVKEVMHESELREECRLLYVAMTRAQDYVFMTGVASQSASEETSGKTHWYRWVKQAFEAAGVPSTDEFLHGFQAEGSTFQLGEVMYEAFSQFSSLSEKKSDVSRGGVSELPAWIATPPHTEKPQGTQSILQPDEIFATTLFKEDDILFSPLFQHKAIKRGIVIHQLLQLLPSIALGEQEVVARRMLSLLASEWEESERQSVWFEVQKIIHEPPFGLLFSAHSRAEVPMIGRVKQADGSWQEVSGQVDRLVVTDEEVWIVDYKTTQHVSASVEEIPLSYRQQLARYAQILTHIYPKHRIRTAILYTSKPCWFEIGWSAQDSSSQSELVA